MELLGYFGIAPGQLMPNSWRIVINCMEIWLAANEDMIKVSELVYLYCLKELKEYGYYELVLWARRTRIVKGLASSFRYWKSCFFLMFGDDFETPSSKAWGDIPRLLSSVGNPKLRCVKVSPHLLIFILLMWSSLTPLVVSLVVKRRPKLKSKYQGCVEKAIEYANSIESWEDLVDPLTLAFFCLGLDPSPYILRNIDIEEKKSKC